MDNDKTAKRRAMRDKISLALKDARNGSITAIYARIRRTGSPFKTGDGRCKYGKDPIICDHPGLSRQTIHYRLNKGWSIEKATTTPLMREAKRKKNGQDNRTDISNSVLEE